MWETIVTNILGFVIGSVLLMLVMYFLIGYFIDRIIKKITSDELKNRFAKWAQAAIREGVADALEDKKIKKIVLEILELTKEKIEKPKKNKKNKKKN